MNENYNKLVTILALVFSSGAVFAHGESIRGGGGGSINAVGATILKEKVIGLRWDARRYDVFTDAEMVQFKRDREDVHMHSAEDAYFLSFGFPVSDNMDISILTQYNNFKKFKDNGDDFANNCFAEANLQNDADSELAKCLSPTDDSPGLGDTLVTGRYRFYRSHDHQIASIFGIIVPTGKITNLTDNGEIIGTHNQPGSGAVTFQGGLGYNGHLHQLSKIDITANVIFRANTQGAKQFRSGNSMQADLAFSHVFGDFIPMIEFNYIKFLKDLENDEVKKNSGGQSLAISPGMAYSVTKKLGVYANYSFIFNDLGGISNDESYRFSLGVSYAFESPSQSHDQL